MTEPQLHFVRRGSGPALLLVHGLGASLRVWDPVAERLAEEREVIAVDLPGFGGSPMPGGEAAHTPAAMAAALVEACRSIGVERPHVAGNSLGGWVALEMAKQGAVASVAAISPAGLWRRVLGPRAYNVQGAGRRLRPLVNGLLRTGRGRSVVLRTTMAHPERMPSEAAGEMFSAYLDSPGYEAANAAMRADVFVHEGQIDVPVAIAWGELDRLVGPPSRTRVPPGATLVRMPGWGHMPTWDDPDGVAAFLLEASASSVASNLRSG